MFHIINISTTFGHTEPWISWRNFIHWNRKTWYWYCSWCFPKSNKVYSLLLAGYLNLAIMIRYISLPSHWWPVFLKRLHQGGGRQRPTLSHSKNVPKVGWASGQFTRLVPLNYFCFITQLHTLPVFSLWLPKNGRNTYLHIFFRIGEACRNLLDGYMYVYAKSILPIIFTSLLWWLYLLD